MKDFEKNFTSFVNKLKLQDEKLYYEFLNLWEETIGKMEKSNKQILENDKKILENDLKIEKLDRNRYDIQIELENKFSNLKKQNLNDLEKLRKEMTSKEYDEKLLVKFMEYSNALALAVMGSPRKCGFMLMIGGKSTLDNLEKFVDKNRDELKDHVVKLNSQKHNKEKTQQTFQKVEDK